MRVGPFANAEIIDKLNRYCVPVMAVIEDYEKNGRHEKQGELLRSVWADASAKKLPAGSVHVFLLKSDGTVINSQHVRDSIVPAKLLRFLEVNLTALETKPGKVLRSPKPLSDRPAITDDQLLLKIEAEYSRYKKVVAEDWVTLSPDEWKQFLPSGGAKGEAKKEWSIDGALAKKILVHVFPYSLDWNPDEKQVSFATLKLTALPIKDGKQRVVIRGLLSMRHNLYMGKDPKPVMAQLVGTATVGADGKPEIVITTMNAKYDNKQFDALVRSVAETN